MTLSSVPKGCAPLGDRTVVLTLSDRPTLNRTGTTELLETRQTVKDAGGSLVLAARQHGVHLRPRLRRATREMRGWFSTWVPSARQRSSLTEFA